MSENSTVDAATRLALQDLMTEFAHRVDRGLGDRVHELFTEDGTITGPGLAMTSRREIAEQFAARAADPARVARHFWSNPCFEVMDDHHVRVTTAVQTFIHRREEGESGPATRYALIVGDSTDVMRRCDDGHWRFASRHLDVIFRTEP